MITILHTIILLTLIAYVIWLENRLRAVEARATVLKETAALEAKMIDNVNERVMMNRKQIETIVKCNLNQAYGKLAYEDNEREDKDVK